LGQLCYEKDHDIFHNEVEKTIMEMRDQETTVDDDVPGDILNCWEKMVSKS
jgi:hypothetical protein